MNNLDWCKETIPELFTLNKMISARKGNIPVKVIYLAGEEKCVAFVIEQEQELFAGLTIVTKEPDTKPYVTIKVPDNIIPRFDYTDFFNKLAFDNMEVFNKIVDFDNKDFSEWIDGESIESHLEEYITDNIDEAASNTLLCHFDKYDDNTFHIPEDLSWVYKVPFIENAVESNTESLSESISISEPESVSESVSEQVNLSESESESASEVVLESESISETESESLSTSESESTSEVIHSETAAVEEPVPAVEEKKAPAPAPTKKATMSVLFGRNKKKQQDKDVSVKFTKDGQAIAFVDTETPQSPEEVMEEEVPAEDAVPKPTFKKNKETGISVKDVLTEDEIKSNKELLDNIRREYNDCIKFIEDSCNTSYRIILNTMKECNDKLRYNKPFCKMYLETGNPDLGSELYAKLYALDQLTVEFNKKVVHQVKKIGCFSCNHTWNEDITFLSDGPHFVECPKCFTEIPFEK